MKPAGRAFVQRVAVHAAALEGPTTLCNMLCDI